MAMSRLTDRVGQVLSERYRLLAPIGTGASASVYLADDVTLRRRVAVKILHAALAEDEAFLRRFRAEAQAAAALNHPNVMAVFDWGHDDVPFLVTEYLGGGSLRTILDQGRLLTPAQSLVVGLQAARGLDYAHRRGFVHRDIKPANLLFDEEARLRIADFGLARALAEAAWTEPQGAVLGTARYASPEQARGETLDGRSDVYSLALVMIEAVTGRVPFSGDTTIGTLMARVDQPVDVPESLGPLRVPLLEAGVTRPADRPDAAEFTRALMIAAEQLDQPEPIVLAGAMVHDHDVVADRDPTVMRNPDAEPDIMSAPPGTVIDGIRVIPDGDERSRSAGDDQSPPLTRLVPDGDGDTDADRRGRARTGRRRWRVVTLSILLVLALAGAGATWWFDVRVPSHTVPPLVGTNVVALDRTVGHDNWVVRRTNVTQDGTVPGQILAQSPTAGSHLRENGVLALTVSMGPPPVAVPTDLAGKPLVAATSELQADGLAVGPLTYQYDETHPHDIVLGVAGAQPGEAAQGLEGAARGVQRAEAAYGALLAGRRTGRPGHRCPPSARARRHHLVPAERRRRRRHRDRVVPRGRRAGAQGQHGQPGGLERSADGDDPGRHRGQVGDRRRRRAAGGGPVGQRHPGITARPRAGLDSRRGHLGAQGQLGGAHHRLTEARRGSPQAVISWIFVLSSSAVGSG